MRDFYSFSCPAGLQALFQFVDSNVCVPSGIEHLGSDKAQVAVRKTMIEAEAMIHLVQMAAVMSLVVLIALVDVDTN